MITSRRFLYTKVKKLSVKPRVLYYSFNQLPSKFFSRKHAVVEMDDCKILIFFYTDIIIVLCILRDFLPAEK